MAKSAPEKPKPRPRVRLRERDLRRAASQKKALPDIAEALGVALGRLTEALAKRPRLRAAYDRGRLLYRVRRLSYIGSSYDEAARSLGREPAAFRRLVEGDPELLDTWRSGRTESLQALTAALWTQAQSGSVPAIRTAIERLQADLGPRSVDLRSLRVGETAAAFGVSRQSIHDWSRKGCPRNADGTFPLAELIEWRVAQLLERSGERPAATAESRFRAARAEAAEMDLRERRGQLLDRREVVVGIIARVHRFVQIQEGEATALAGELAGKPPELIADILQRRFVAWRRMMIPELKALRLPTDAEAELAGLLDRLAAGGGGGS